VLEEAAMSAALDAVNPDADAHSAATGTAKVTVIFLERILGVRETTGFGGAVVVPDVCARDASARLTAVVTTAQTAMTAAMTVTMTATGTTGCSHSATVSRSAATVTACAFCGGRTGY